MNKASKIIALVGAGLGFIAALITFFVGGFVEVIGNDDSIANMGTVAILMSIVLIVLTIISLLKSSKIIPGVILVISSFTGIAGGTLVFLALLPCVIGSFLSLLGKDPTREIPIKFYERWWFWSILALCGFALGLLLTFENTDESTDVAQDMVPEYRLTADELMSAYENNKLAAESKYNGKIVQVEGIIYSISASGEQAATVTLHGNGDNNWLKSVNCNFTGDEQISGLAELSKDMLVSIIGVVRGEDIMSDIVLDNCRFANADIVANSMSNSAPDPGMQRSSQVVSVVQQWNLAHNTVDMDLLASLYANNVDLYGERMSNAQAVSLKTRQLTGSYRGYQQTVSNFSIEELWDIHPRVEFVKTATVNGKTNSYDAYMILEESAGKWSIIVESDLSTERRLGQN